MRVLFACGADLSGPDEKQFLRFGRELVRRGHEVMMCVRTVHPDAARLEEVPDGVTVRAYRLAGRRPVADSTAAVTAFRPQLVHALSPRAGLLAAAIPWARASDAPLLVHFADDEWGLAKGLGSPAPRARAERVARRTAATLMPRVWPYATRASLRRARREAAALDALTPALAEHVEHRLGRPCSVVLPIAEDAGLPSDPTRALALPEPFASEPFVAYTGAIQPVHERDVRLALRAIAAVQRRGTPVRFVHAGTITGDLHPVRLAEEEGVAAGTALALGYIPSRDIPALLRTAAVLVQPGAPTEFNRLRLPAKLSSYLGSGTPVVTYAAGFGELLEDRTEVLKTHTAEPGELADRLQDALTDAALRSELARGGPRAARRLFDAGRNTDALVAHYEQALAAPRGPDLPRR